MGIAVAVAAVGARDARAAKSPSLKCRAAVAQGVDGIIKSGLKALDSCHKQRDKGRSSADCNALAANANVVRALARARSKVDALCRAGDPVLQNYPSATTDGVKNVLFPAVVARLEQSGRDIQGAPTFEGDKATVKRLARCHGAIGKARSAIVGEIFKASSGCQKRLDKGASQFSAIAPECIASPGGKSGKAVGKVSGLCSGIEGATVGSCASIPDCIVNAATADGQLLARLAFGGPTQCGNGLQELGEDCDDGNTADGDDCPATCRNAACGDGVRAGSEECDDGNTSNADACTNTCETARCGDGFVQEGVEECDDAAPAGGTACVSCELAAATCGADGLVQATVELQYPEGNPRPGVLRAQLEYPDFVSIPGAEDAPEVLAAITDLSGVGILVARDDDAASAVTVAYLDFDNSLEPNLVSGPLYRAQLRGCAAGTPIRPRDFACTVVEVGDPLGGPLQDVTCRVLSLTASGITPPTTSSTAATPTTSSSTSSAAGTTSTSTTLIAALCGNGMVDAGETCDDGNTVNEDSCPGDCAVDPCTPTLDAGPVVTVSLDNQQGTAFGVATVFLDYPEGLVLLPGSGEDSQAQAAVTGRPTSGSPTCVVNDRDHGLQFGCFSFGGAGFPEGQLFSAAFKRCQGAAAPTAQSFRCTVIEAGAAGTGEEVSAICTVTLT